MPDRRAAREPAELLQRGRAPRARDPRRVPAQPVLQPRQPGRPTTPPPAPRSGSRPTGSITHFVAGMGTGGTITGVGRYLKAHNPDVQIVGADPVGSIYSAGDRLTPKIYKVEGIGEDFMPSTLDCQSSTASRCVDDKESFLMTAPALTREEGILVGGSSGTALVGRAALAPRGRRSRGAGRRAAARHGPQLPEQDLQRRLDARERLSRTVPDALGGRRGRQRAEPAQAAAVHRRPGAR